MELQEQDIALLEAYLKGGLAEGDLRACEARLANEPAFAEALTLLRELEPATRMTARAAMRKGMQAAKIAAVAAGMAAYVPAINPPKAESGFLIRLIKFLITVGIMALASWVIWKYFKQNEWPYSNLQPTSEHFHADTTSTTKTIIRMDTSRSSGSDSSQQPRFEQ